MESKVAGRIIELAMMWQKATRWRTAYGMQAKIDDELFQMRELRRNGDREAAQEHKRLAQYAAVYVSVRRTELKELTKLVREHSPKLLHLVPTTDFQEVAQPTDAIILGWTSDLRTLESAVRNVQRMKTKQRRRTPPKSRPILTERQVEAMTLYGECQSNIAQVARRMGVGWKVARQHVEAGFKNAGKTMTKKPKTTRHKTDRRGAVEVAEIDKKNGGSGGR